MGQTMKQIVADKLAMPKDVVLGDMIITIMGDREVIIENYKGIIEYNSQRIIIQGKHSTLSLTGKDFLIKYFTNDDMKVEGCIQSIQYNS